MTTAFDYEAKIAALLRKAEAKGTTSEEAESLTKAAERLMVKFGIDQAMIDAKKAAQGEVTEKIITETLTFTGIYRHGYETMAHFVVDGLGTMKNLQEPTRVWDDSKGKYIDALKVWLIGFESDVRQAAVLIRSLEIQSLVAMNAWWKANKDEYRYFKGMDQFKIRRNFIGSFGIGVRERLIELKRTEVAERETGTELVLVDRKKRVESWLEDNIDTRKSRGADVRGNAAGRQAGRNANIGQKAVDNSGRKEVRG